MPKRKLYNRRQKEEYLKYEAERNQKSNTKSLEGYFARLCPIEKKFKKDIVDMTIDEYREAISLLNITRVSYVGVCLSVLNGYHDWARRFGKTDNADMLMTIDPTSIDIEGAIRAQMIKDRDELEEIILLSCHKFELKNTGVRDELILRLLYAGLEDRELGLLKKDSINKTGIILVECAEENGKPKIYQVDKKIIEAWGVWSNIDCIEFSRRGGNVPMEPLVANDYLFRGIAFRNSDSTKPVHRRYFYPVLVSMFERYEKKMGSGYRKSSSPNQIRTSGKFNRLLEMERNGTDIALDVIEQMFELKVENMSGKKAYDAEIYKIMDDYVGWKVAFKHEQNV